MADALNGGFASGPSSEIALSGFSGFTGLTAGDTQGGLHVTLNTGTAGAFTPEHHAVRHRHQRQRLQRDPRGRDDHGHRHRRRAAIATLNTPGPLTLANQRVGGSPLTDALSFTNSATPPAEALDVSITGTTGAVTASGSVAQLGAGQTDATGIVAGVNTGTAGAQSGTVTLTEDSDGTGIDGTGTTAIGTVTVDVSGDVYREGLSESPAPRPRSPSTPARPPRYPWASATRRPPTASPRICLAPSRRRPPVSRRRPRPRSISGPIVGFDRASAAPGARMARSPAA